MRYLAAILLALLALPAGAQVLAIAPIKLLDTSHEARSQGDDHARRLAILAGVLASQMPGQLIDAQTLAKACPTEDAPCLVASLRGSGADRGLFIVVQKTSTLILQVFANLVDLKTEKLIVHKELNFRGDNDEAWRRAGQFLSRQLRDAG